ncbi:FAD-dependent monooxygenase [Amycolatopsis sp. SID8362]|uniref:FAD-dependent monooxygenase n=1 Tax=Amycolatopsis sp. SID8362 TaxID=2690346 RepID=UPI001368CAA2|nr:FAD-dependent monooxygenase [Amycolatopsis sp. SID8362]NBH12115.1 NAD-binding protein [Amycolatopsis sp. SID8362]NED48807.1 NAD-binding protein [Amycolatopsis sp. SID8362]
MNAAVIVVGAGPVGLMLAGELRLAGVEVLVVERLSRPSGESRGLGFTARTLEVFDQRGLLPGFGDVEISPRGHFGGVPLDYTVLEGAHFGARGIPQTRTEAVLAKWVEELGAPVLRDRELVGLHDTGDGVEIEVRGPDGLARLRAEYLVGCDGGRSSVRKLAGFAFPGTDATREMFLADVAGCALRARPIGEKLPGGMVMSAPTGDGVDRIIVCERGAPPRRRGGPPEFAEVAAAWQRITGEDIGHGRPVWVSAFGDATRQVTEYRRGRVLLAGDAAHTHLPAGGQGLSFGVQDAVNLGWKLAAHVLGRAPAGLLDTYHAERHPAGVRLLRNTLAQGLLYLSGSEVEPLREVMAELMGLDVVGRHLAGMVSGLDVRYDTGAGEHPLLGRRLPDHDLVRGDGKIRAYELLHPARGVLLDFGDDAGLRTAAAGWADRVDVVTATPYALDAGSGLTDTGALLVRPDGYVAWTAPGTAAALDTALERWFGAPLPNRNHPDEKGLL